MVLALSVGCEGGARYRNSSMVHVDSVKSPCCVCIDDGVSFSSATLLRSDGLSAYFCVKINDFIVTFEMYKKSSSKAQLLLLLSACFKAFSVIKWYL